MSRAQIELDIRGAAAERADADRLGALCMTCLQIACEARALADPSISVVLTDDAQIAALNAEWRGEARPTDVLSFPLLEPGEEIQSGCWLGDIVVSVECAERYVASRIHLDRLEQSGAWPDAPHPHWGLEEELRFLLLHGLLHLLGYDHAEPAEERAMRAEEARLYALVAA